MNEKLEKTVSTELETKLTQILDWVEQSIKTAGDFVAEQAPLYIQELLAWNFWFSLIWFCAGFALLITFFCCLRTVIKSDQNFWSDKNSPRAIPVVLGGAISLIIGVPLTCSNLEWLKICVAPRVFLLEYVADKL